jgi:dTDP-4-dehydrorhamnose reductase
MKILVTGAGGMLGSDLVQRLAPKHQVVGVGRKPAPHPAVPFQQVNLTEALRVNDCLDEIKPEVILHAAAMTEVDTCETNRHLALLDNFETTRNICNAANRLDSMVVYFGTDFIFDGKKSSPYVEEDLPRPLSVYGETKLLGERYVRLRAKRYLILRTSWLFGKQGNSFPKKILRQAEAGNPIRVVTDEFGNPTYTWDLAGAVSEILEALAAGDEGKRNQIYHVANEGAVSRYELARAILKKRNLPLKLLVPVSQKEAHFPAARPQNSALSTEKLKDCFGIKLRPWEEALDAYLVEDLAGIQR